MHQLLVTSPDAVPFCHGKSDVALFAVKRDQSLVYLNYIWLMIARYSPSICFTISSAPDFTSTKKFETKHQMLHRLQEGISFGDGNEYCMSEYQRVASQRTRAWKAARYPDHDLLARHASTNAGSKAESKMFTPENLEREYWDIVELSQEVAVEYANDIDTFEFGSGFPLSQRGRAINGTKILEKMNEPEPEFGTAEYYRETWWNLNNIPSAPNSVLRHVRVGINGM